jgi:hypothetical protein
MPSRRTALSIVRWTIGRRLPVAVPVITGPIPRPALVGLAGGRTRAAVLREQVEAEQPKRAAGA